MAHPGATDRCWNRPVSAMAIHPAQTFATPSKASRTLVRAVGAGDLEVASSCFARDACFVAPDATAAHGHDEIRQVLAQMIAVDTRVKVEARAALLAGEIALVSERWRISFRDVHGTPFRQASPATMVLRRIGGRWSLAIAAPWGWGNYDRG